MSENAVETRHLTKRFGAFVAVDDVSFAVPHGEVFGLLGSNGAGKSTAIRMLCGLLAPSSGQALVLDLDVARHPDEVRRRIGYMTQRFSLYDDLTVAQNLRFYGGVYGLRRQRLNDRIAWALDTAGLGSMSRTPTGALSAGWKQRLALVCALLHEPKVVFLDEPTGGVDPLSRRRFWDLIDGLAAGGVTVIVTTHYLDEAEHCARIALMHASRVVALGSVTELKDVFAGRAVLEVTCERPLEAQDLLARQQFVLESAVFGTRLHVVVADAADGARRIADVLGAAGHGPARVERIVPSLEDVFIHSIEQAESGAAQGAGPHAA